MTALANPKDSALRETNGAEKLSSNQEAMRLTLEWEKALLSEECTKAPNETQDQRPLARARVAAGRVWKSWKARTRRGQRFAASPG